MFVSRVDYSEAMVGYCFSRNNLWMEYSPNDIKGFPVCTLRGRPTNKGNITRVLGDSLIYGPFYEGYSPGGLVMPDILGLVRVRHSISNLNHLGMTFYLQTRTFYYQYILGYRMQCQLSLYGPNQSHSCCSCRVELAIRCISPLTDFTIYLLSS